MATIAFCRGAGVVPLDWSVQCRRGSKAADGGGWRRERRLRRTRKPPATRRAKRAALIP